MNLILIIIQKLLNNFNLPSMTTSSRSYILIILLLISSNLVLSQEIDISPYEYPKKEESTADTYTIAIFGTNDIHGKIFPIQYPHPDGVNTYQSGGVEYIYAYKKILEKEWGDRLLWLDGGDQFQGGMEFMLSDGEIMNMFYNAAGVQGMAIGNHEFDFGLDFLKNKMGKSKFKYLVANIKNKTTGEFIDEKTFPNLKRYHIYQVGEIKVCVIGLATRDTPTTTSTPPSDLSFEPYLEIVKELSTQCRNEGANAVVLLPHFGPMCPDSENKKLEIGLRNKNTEQCSCQNIEYNELLNALPEGIIDAAVAAHVHDVSHHWIGNVPVIESTGAAYSHVIYLPFKKEGDKYVLQKDTIQIEGPLPSCPLIFEKTKRCDYVPMEKAGEVGELKSFKFHGTLVKQDEEMKKTLKEWSDIIEAKLKNEIAKNEEAMFTDSYEETALSNLVTDVARKVTGAHVSLFNLGGFRGNWYPGMLNEVDLFYMFPFNNTFVTCEMNGRELIRMIKEIQTGYHVNPSSGLIQLFKKVTAERIKIIDAKLFDGYLEKSINLDGTYVLGLNDFLLSGGSFFSKVLKWYTVRNKKDYGIIREHMTNYLKAMGIIKKGSLIDPAHPRIRYLSDKN